MAELHPGLFLLLAAAVVAVAPLRWRSALTVGAGIGALALTLTLAAGDRVTYDFYGIEVVLLRADALSLAFATVFAAVTVLVGIYGWATMGRQEQVTALATAGAGLGVVLAGDLLTLFFFWELKVSTAVLLILARRSSRSNPAGMRYLGVHLVGGVVLLTGVLWWWQATGSLAFDEIGLGSWAAALILVGMLLSAAVPPLNAWLPDAYPVATVAGTVALSAFTTKSAVYALARGFPGLELLLWLGVAMAVFGVVFAILEDDIRRLLSYHIVSQVGFMVAAIGVGTSMAVDGATAHAYAHVLYKGLLLMAAGAVLHATGRSRASELGGLSRALPWVLVLYMVGALSISGAPLFSGFPAKELSVGSVGDAGEYAAQWLLKAASVGTVLSVALKLPLFTWAGTARGSTTVRRIPTSMYVAMGLAAAANLALGLRPGLLYDQLPGPVTFAPYSLDAVVMAVQLLAFTAVGYWLLRSRLVPKARESVDTDWAYRELPAMVSARAGALRERVPPLRPPRLHIPVPDRPPRPGALPGWVLGTVLMAAMATLLLTSVLS
ncbi:Na(+)/H(+) antiporter subunit D [Rhabdothermincola salaria]|uniref:Na(+)/H(+) antiporter subunit D n=1 Tax=Rhabdothermincola salaria TaxID=2903142 RepID=UPI001E65632E|nr:Na(+)/H(+) antiporter subunit D [Rhabdothermincola salaria]MCD9623050.1 Na(+)/H(+) antiporter subunit D [Rhabdothermincola salaria]